MCPNAQQKASCQHWYSTLGPEERHISLIRLYSAIHFGSHWKYMTEDKLKIQKLNKTQNKQIAQNTAKQNYSGSVARKRNRLILQCTRAHTKTNVISWQHQMTLTALMTGQVRVTQHTALRRTFKSSRQLKTTTVRTLTTPRWQSAAEQSRQWPRLGSECLDRAVSLSCPTRPG